MKSDFLSSFLDSVSEIWPEVWDILYLFMPFWLPFFLIIILWNFWLSYVRTDFANKQNYKLLEIKLPNEIKRSPLAMELFLNTLFQTGGEGTWYAKYVQGKSRPMFSLEIVSLEGQVKFFIWTRGLWKNLIESQIYAQYPDIEIFEVQNYTSFVNYDPKSDVSLWGMEYKLTEKDFYPIKTYVDYGMNREGIKDEERIDPITPIMEFLGSVEEGQQVWLQIVIKAHKKERRKALSWKERWEKKEWSKFENWRDEAKAEIKEKIEGYQLDKKDPVKGHRMLTKGETEIIAAIERSVTKMSFDCNIRSIYLAEKDHFNLVNVMGLLGAFKQFNSLDLNGFGVAMVTDFDYPWQDYKNIRKNALKKAIFNRYKRREFSDDYSPFVLNTEELATIYHFPGGVAQTPTLSRLNAKKAEAPFNLPI